MDNNINGIPSMTMYSDAEWLIDVEVQKRDVSDVIIKSRIILITPR